MTKQFTPPKPVTDYDVFISYSRRNGEFAEAFYKKLSDYQPPKGLDLPLRRLNVFLDKRELYGNDLDAALRRNLLNSAKLIVLCSPESRSSRFVNQEIREFAVHNGARNVIPILVSGKPNHETQDEAEKAFPEALYEVLATPEKEANPLAVDYREFRVNKDKFGKDRYYDPWFASLANVYEKNRDQLEQREKQRQTRKRWIGGSVVTAAFLALSSLLIWALISRNAEAVQRAKAEAAKIEANQQRDFATQKQQEADSANQQALIERDNAKQSAVEANKQRLEAIKQRNVAIEQQQLAESRLYVADMNLAQQIYAEGDMVRVKELLDWHSPQIDKLNKSFEDRRDFYWHYLQENTHRRIVSHRGGELVENPISPDGKLILTVDNSESPRIKLEVHSLDSGKRLISSEVSSSRFFQWADAKKIFAVSYESKSPEILSIDAFTGDKKIYIKPSGIDDLKGMQVSPNKNWLALWGGGKVEIWGIKNVRKKAEFSDAYSAEFAPNSEYVAIYFKGDTAKVLDTGEKLRV